MVGQCCESGGPAAVGGCVVCGVEDVVVAVGGVWNCRSGKVGLVCDVVDGGHDFCFGKSWILGLLKSAVGCWIGFARGGGFGVKPGGTGGCRC